MTRLTTDKVKNEFFGTIERVAGDGERIVLERSGKSIAAIVPMEDLELLRRIETCSTTRPPPTLGRSKAAFHGLP